ncbi:MAG: hypothetical protein KJN66_09265, partial [Bacteroidia bacterium]|nr:hypothetical protein [Bacteroidia bacterium]
VILLVIGILIALQLNNMNEANKNKGYEKEYLFRIQSDINQDIAELEKHFKTDTLKLDSYTFLSRLLRSNSINTSPETLLMHLSRTAKLNWFEGKNIVFEDMKSSGKTSLIASDTLRNKIQIYYRLFEEVIKQERLNNNNIIKYIDNINASIDPGPFIEAGMQKRWNANFDQITSIDLFYTVSNLDDNKKNLISNNYSLTKTQILSCHAIRFSLYQEGIKISKSIDDYLKLNK